VKRIGAATALEVRATGIPYVFAPCIAVTKLIQLLIAFRISDFLTEVMSSLSTLPVQVCRDPRWGRCFESYSEDPKIVQAMTVIVQGLQGDIPTNSRKGVPFVGGR
jgi:beta-glucosidase